MADPDNSVPFATALRDACHVCKGTKGGVPGNENLMPVCDYCDVDPHSTCHERERKLREYVTHRTGCVSVETFTRLPSGACNCGLAELLAAKAGE